MGAYWVMFFVPALMSIIHDRQAPIPQGFVLSPAWTAAGVAVVFAIGFRYQVGGDWYNYLRNLEEVRGLSFWETVGAGDPAYQAVSFLSLRLGWDIYGVNMICALLFCSGLFALCRQQPNPWLALAVAVPYLVIVVGMGYTRQAAALGLALLGLNALMRGQSILRFTAWIIMAAAFHRSAIVLIPIIAFASASRLLFRTIWAVATSITAFYLYVASDLDRYYENYVGAEMQSQGTLIRLLMNLAPAMLLIAYRERLHLNSAERSVWYVIALAAVAMFGLYFVIPSSTVIDRISLYFLPLQIIVFGRLSYIHKARADLAVLVVYALAQFVWLNFAVNAYAWAHYKSVLLL